MGGCIILTEREVTKRVQKGGAMVDIKERMAKRLRDLRGNKEADEVAKACGISRSALGMYEIGARIPRDEVKVRLARFYKTSVQDIFFAQ